MTKRLDSLMLASALLLGQLPLQARAEPIQVIATIVPIHSLAAGIMEGIAEPTLLVKGGASPHNFQLKPSDAKALGRAKLIFWVGPEVEILLAKPIASVPKTTEVVELLDIEGLRALEPREGGVWGAHDHDHDHGRKKKGAAHSHEEEERDGHVWLDPINAAVIVKAMVEKLGKADPANAERYRANGAKLEASLRQLDGELAQTLGTVKDKPFIVLHDAYQYLETRYDLKAAGAITVTPDKKPSAKRLTDLRRTIKERGSVCVFDEPQVQTSLVPTLVEGTNARAGKLDPEGSSSQTPGPEAYFRLMRQNAEALLNCLGGPKPS